MIVIYAEKENMGAKIAAALDCIHLNTGKNIDFKSLDSYKSQVEQQQKKDKYLKIKWKGQECYVTWGWGHMVQLKQAKDYDSLYKNWAKLPVPFIPEHYLLKPVETNNSHVKKRNDEQLKIVKELFNKADYIISATDSDREGELIFAYLYQYLRCSTPYKRVLFDSQSKDGIKTAFDNLVESKDRKNVEMAGRARSVTDWVIGANLTAQTTIHNKSKNILSIGRLQMATLNLIVEKEKQIKNFKPEDYYAINAVFTTRKSETYKATYEKKKITTNAEAEKIISDIKSKQGIVSNIESKKVKVEPPLLYRQTTLQIDCNKKFGFTLAHTLEIAQSLYDKGLTTYPRTSSQCLNEDMKDMINDIYDKLQKTSSYGKYLIGKDRKFYKKRYFDNSKVGSHYAIIPTGEIPKSLTNDEHKVYDLIVKSLIRINYPDAYIMQTKITTTVSKHNFITNGKSVDTAGWLEITPENKEEIIPKLELNEKVIGEYKKEKKTTQPPKRYTDATLVSAMVSAGKDLKDEELRKIMSDPNDGGIGTEATRAGIVDILEQRKYIKRIGKSIIPTEQAILLIDGFPVDELKFPEFTAKFEQNLNRISDGTLKYSDFINGINKKVSDWCNEILKSSILLSTNKDENIKCPLCGNDLHKYSWGWGCTNYKNGCKFSVSSTICGKKLTDKQIVTLITKKKTKEINGFISKSGKPFNAALKLNGSKIEFVFKNKA